MAFAALIGCFAIDLATPQTLVVAILFDVPIVIVALAGSRRLTTGMVVLALIADIVAGYANGVAEGRRWEAIGIGDRFLAALSIVLVGYLSVAIQEQGQRAGRAAAQQQRARREAELAAAVDRIRSTLSFELVVRAILKEAPRVLRSITAEWMSDRGTGEFLSLRSGGEIVVHSDSASAEATSLVRRVLDSGQAEVFSEDDAFGRLVAGLVSARAAVAIPFLDAGRTFGVVLLGFDERPNDDVTLGLARAYGRAGSAALAQAELFGELARRNETLAERGAVIRDLIYALSHDLRTPLAALEMTLVQAKDGAYGELPARYREILDASILATSDLQELAETLLHVARFESGEHSGVREPVDVRDLVVEIASEFEALAQARGVALGWSANGVAVTNGDRGDLRRAIRNLVSNALTNTPSGGHVNVDVGVQDAAVQLTVSDDGYGVPAEVRGALFQRFQSASTAGGTGLGLYLVRRVAEDAGGRVGYRADEPSGSIFTLTLPRAASSA